MQSEDCRYWRFFEFAPDAYITSGFDGTIHEANQVARRLLHVRDSPLVGSSLFDLLAEEDRDIFRGAVSRLAVTGWPRQPVEMIVHLHAREAPPFIVQLTASTLGDDSDQFNALAWLVRPVSLSRDVKAIFISGKPSRAARDVARQVDEDLLPVVGAVGLSLHHPNLPPDLKLVLAQAAVALDGAVQWMGKLERAVGDSIRW